LKDLTLVNLNLLFIRYLDAVERELHVPLGPLYLVRVLEDAGLGVDFRDFQLNGYDDPFEPGLLADFCADPAPIVGLSCMANLLPFVILGARELKARYPDRVIVLGGVGPHAVEREILEAFPWIDLVGHGEGERSVPALVRCLRNGGDLASVPGIAFRRDGQVVVNPPAPRIEDLDAIPMPAFDRVDLSRYSGYGMITSRGCPFPCTFCSVAPIWGRRPCFRSAGNILEEMRWLHEHAGVELFLFQDEFFFTNDIRVLDFCEALARSGLNVRWKAFGRVNLATEAAMRAMARAGCIEFRLGIESGSPRILERTKKGFTTAQAVSVVSLATRIFPRVDCFFVWGFPFETMEDFRQSVFQMVSFRLMGARILPSLLAMLPQTDLYREYRGSGLLKFRPEMMPEYMVTGHELCDDGHLQLSDRHGEKFDFIAAHPDLFPGFLLADLETNILPKFAVLKSHGFYPSRDRAVSHADSCGAHSPRVDGDAVLGTITRGC
jgi:anaerobic magnesium-protoporphyrin IX monomethyl ester cyclase